MKMWIHNGRVFCKDDFHEILRQRGLLATPSEYGQSVDWQCVADWNTPVGHPVFRHSDPCLSYHCGRVIAVSASGGRKTTCDPVKQHGYASARLAPVETRNIVMIGRVGKGVTATKRLNLPVASRHSESDVKSYTVAEQGSRKRLFSEEGKPRSAQSLPVAVEQKELQLVLDKRLCTKCKVNEAFWSCDWCSDCCWELIKDEQED